LKCGAKRMGSRYQAESASRFGGVVGAGKRASIFCPIIEELLTSPRPIAEFNADVNGRSRSGVVGHVVSVYSRFIGGPVPLIVVPVRLPKDVINEPIGRYASKINSKHSAIAQRLEEKAAWPNRNVARSPTPHPGNETVEQLHQSHGSSPLRWPAAP